MLETFPRGRCTSLLRNWVHDLRDDQLDTPVKYMIFLAQFRKSTHYAEGIHESELPYIPERECSKFPWEVDVQDKDVTYLRIPKRIGCHTEGIPERELPSPLPKGRFDPPHRNVWIAFF